MYKESILDWMAGAWMFIVFIFLWCVAATFGG